MISFGKRNYPNWIKNRKSKIIAKIKEGQNE